jgi:hypothetical protein
MDRLLRDIQAELVPGREPAPALVVAPPAPVSPAAPAPPPVAHDQQTEVITELSARLLASMRELLAGYERMLVGRAVPFPGIEALDEFEAAVARLPGVREVAVQGYEGTDRAIIEVRLGPS